MPSRMQWQATVVGNVFQAATINMQEVYLTISKSPTKTANPHLQISNQEDKTVFHMTVDEVKTDNVLTFIKPSVPAYQNFIAH